ncbi:MAG: sugar transferase [Candidatus Nomurabacteria bacterium]|jgi:lipopolysaccharide/colanic/teichoic acid biosynthesis glycosyltransferase|nr:sugar transferase [Candidatus Nomurabacteria bacterium]
MMKKRASLTFSLLLAVGDAVAILAAYVVAYILRVKVSNVPTYQTVPAHEFLLLLLLLLPFIIILFSLIGTYRATPQGKLAIIGRVFFGAGGAMLFMIMIHYFMNRPLFPSKLVPIYGLIVSIVFLSITRGTLYLIRYYRQRKLLGVIGVVLVGDNKVAQGLVESIKRDRNYLIQAIVGNGKIATHKTWAGATRNFQPDLIIQIATRDMPDINRELLDFAEKNYIEFKFVPREISDFPDKIEPELFMGDVPIMSLRPTPLFGWGRVAKRLFDIVASCLGLVILSPIFLVIAIINRLIFGQVFFKHTRLTRGNQTFGLFKFQTVHNDLNNLSPEEAFKKIGQPELIKKYRDNGDFLPDDPRFGTWARFLRRTSLDELPQFFNVLRGDISLVGPRALAPEELAGYADKHAILNVKSGLTGLAQISGRRDLPWEQRRKLDVYYVQNWSFGFDIQILLKTAWQILTGRGAK